MKILLINPPLSNFNENPYPPLGLAYLGAVLENKGYEVKIVDMPPLKLTSNNLLNIILEYDPNVVGITCFATNYRNCINITKITKQISPSCKIVVGGPHVTFISEKVLKDNPWIDVVVRGEGEKTMLELMEAFMVKAEDLSSIQGITFRTNSGRICNTAERPLIDDIDAIPYPARHLLPINKYKELTKYTSIITSRGCAYNCVYCSASAFWRYNIRFRSPLSVYKEIEFIKHKYNIGSFKFVDDLFLFESKRTYDLLKFFKELEIRWICNTRIDLLNKNLIENAAKSGCEKIIFGIESLSPNVQKAIGKNLKINKKEIKKILTLCNENGIETKLNFILGLPKQTKEDIKNITRLILECKPTELTINQLTPYPGTYVYNGYRNLGIDYDFLDWWEESSGYLISNGYLNSKVISKYSSYINKLALSLGINTMEGY